MATITKIETKKTHPTITIPFSLYVRAYNKAVRQNPRAKTMTISVDVPCSKRVNAFRSDARRPYGWDRRLYGERAWMSHERCETISIPLTSAGRAAVRREHNAPKRLHYAAIARRVEGASGGSNR
jgi:hypothetical protein